MFAGYWSVIPTWFSRVFGRKCLLIVGGTDCVSFPEFNYGSLRKPLISKAIRFSLNNCTTILPVAEELVEYNYTYFDAVRKKQGYKSFFPEVNTPIRIIFNGYEVPKGNPLTKKKPNSFITAARIHTSVHYELKGIDLFVEMARVHSACSFTIVGISNEIIAQFQLGTIQNLRCVPFVGKDELDTLFREHQFYCCLSLSEGFPNALCEGMSYGCIPIGSKVSSIPFIIGDTGFVVERRDADLLNREIQRAIGLSQEQIAARSAASLVRIADSFPLSRRKAMFYNIIEE